MNQYQVILRATNNDQEQFDLELTNSPQFLLDISTIEAGEIGKIFGVSSQEFSLPGNQVNNQFFNNLFDLGTTPAVSLTKTVPCQVLVDGQAVYNGKLYVNTIITDQYNDIIYNCVVVNDTIDFKTQIEKRALVDLNWSAYNHGFNWTNISQSWNDDLANGDIFYPFINYGKDPNNISGSVFEFGGRTLQIDNPNYPAKLSDFKPAIRARAVLDTIFDSVNYKYTSSFIDSAYFDNVYLLTAANENKGPAILDAVSESVIAYPNTNQTIPQTNSTTVEFNAELFDNGGNFNTSTYEYTVSITGQHIISTRLNYQITGYDTGGFLYQVRYADIQVIVNRASVDTVLNRSKPAIKSNQGNLGFAPAYYQLQAGDKIRIEIYFQPHTAGEDFVVQSGPDNYLQISSPTTAIGGTVDMGLQFPDDLKVVDFINSLALKYNLIIEPVTGTKNVIRIEPFNTWVDAGTVVDWSSKVDRNIKWEIRHPLGDEPKIIKFTDELDQDVINQYQIKNFGRTYGSYDYFADSDLITGEKVIKPLFAATPVKGIPGGPTTVIPQLYKQDDPSKYGVPFKFKPRLLHKQSLKIVAGNEAKGMGYDDAALVDGFYWLDTGSANIAINYYRTLGPTTESPSTFTGSFDIHYNNTNYYPYQQNFVYGRTANDAFQSYWAYYINELFDIDTRLVTMNIVLKPSEIETIRLNSKIFIDGHYYRINKIQGANLIEEQSTQVELLKTLPRKLPFPRRRVYTTPTDFIDVTQEALENNGTTTYSDFETGTIITSSAILGQAASRDGNEVYGESTVWDIIKPIIFNPNVTVIGTVNYDETSNGVLFVGNDITIPQNTVNVSVLNPNRELTEYKSDTVYVGASVTQGRRATEYLTIPVYSGSQLAITSSGDQYPFYLYTWDNASGSGTAFVDLPDTADLDGVEYQFQLSSSFSGSRSVTLVPSGSQVIDGTANTILTIPGTLYQFKAVDGGWITTLAPSTAGALTVTEGESVTVSPVTTLNFVNATVSGSGTTATVTIPTINTATFATTGSNQFYGNQNIEGSVQISGSLKVTGSITSPVIALTASAGTASMDLSKGNAFVITLTTSSATYITATNIEPNQHVSLLVNQGATATGNGNLFFTGSAFYFPSGSEYVTSFTSGSKDIITFETFTFNPPVLAATTIQYKMIAATKGPIITSYMSASGGQEFISGSYRIHKFTGSANLVVHSLGTAAPGAYEYLILGGGGGGSGGISGTAYGSGGGAGDCPTGSGTFSSTASYVATIGTGGAGSLIDVNASAGGNSSFNGITAFGGGGGLTGTGGSNSFYSGAARSGLNGGGGAGSGQTATVSTGGNGKQSAISGSSIYYGGGGGGGTGPGTAAGGLGGGGNGSSATGSAGTDYLGAGGGGSGNFNRGGEGGDGVIIIKYQYTA